MAVLGGAVGATALPDAGPEDRISVVPGQLPSEALVDLAGRCGAVLLLNRGKTARSGLAFGLLVARKAAGRTAPRSGSTTASSRYGPAAPRARAPG